MITPHFVVRQDDEYVYIDLKVTHLRAQNVELRADDDIFVFSLPPYYLRLHLPGNILDDDRASAEFDLAASTLHVKFPKETPGEDFPDLDLATKLLARVGPKDSIASEGCSAAATKKPLIEELDGSELEPDGDNGFGAAAAHYEALSEAEAFDWQIEQSFPTDDDISLLTAKYGFNNQYSGFLRAPSEVGNDINDIGAPETSTVDSRRQERLTKENEKFDPEYYLSDLLDNPDIEGLLHFEPQLVRTIHTALEAGTLDAVIAFTPTEIEKMTVLPRRTYLIPSSDELRQVYLNILPLLFAYCYDIRTTMDDHTPESPWTIGKLAANIACLDTSDSTLSQIMATSVRRSLAYPLYRNYSLSIKCWDDVYYILRGGKRAILRAFLDINTLFSFHDVYYVYSKIVMEDYCAWIQTAQDTVIRSLAHDVHNAHIPKDALGWDIPELEQMAND
ncbi:SHQ1 protein-domain-containing protein [Limtongia smithiae]|uniref:SHQ1 protein-domain-containing protein n=1 Tax=Limtongia smithiae TaxID=1125753 RepID=UPI0034CF9894